MKMKRAGSRQSRKPDWKRAEISQLVLETVASHLDLDDVAHAIASKTLGLQHIDRPVSFDANQSSSDFRREYWKAEVLSKFPFEISGVDRVSAAMETFRLAELRCIEANHHLLYLETGSYPDRLTTIIRKARSILRGLLKDITPEEVMQRAHWGPGATTSLPRASASPQNKWVLGAHCTESALPWVKALWQSGGDRYIRHDVHLVSGNRVVTVAKNAKTDRTIAIEPDWNCFFQLGLGAAIRSRLQRRGILCSDAQDQNRRLARYGSLTGNLSTIDLKSASDTLSLALCDLLLPQNIATIMTSLRSPMGATDSGVVAYEKISSMGNGTTFELEAAMFYAIVKAINPDDLCSVYGDDIITSTSCTQETIDTLQQLGLEVNLKKTHTSGPFRESCGGHYFKGIDVTPPYFREAIKDVPSYIRAYNKLLRVMQRDDPIMLRIRSSVPKFLWGPAHRGDTVLTSEWDESTPTWMPRYQSYRLKEITERRNSCEAPDLGKLAHALWGAAYNVEKYPGKRRVIAIQSYQTDRWY